MTRPTATPPAAPPRSSWRMLSEAGAAFLAAAPVLYSLILPLAVLDLWVRAYEALCFPVFGIAKVPRSRYLVFDRARLPYLNALERAACLYCSYANGVVAYCREVAARTEQYFCPIRHARRPDSVHARYAHFAAYGDAAVLRASARRLRGALRPLP